MATASARAEQPAKSKKAAKTHFQRGVELYKNEDYRGAADAFAQAYERDKNPSTLYAWAQAERLADNCPKAIELYRQFLGTNPSDKDREAATRGLSLCAAKETPEPEPEPEPQPKPQPKPEIEPKPAPVVEVPKNPEPQPKRPSRPRFGLFVRTDVESKLSGAATAPGLAVRLFDRWQLFASGLISASYGFEAGLRLHVTTTRIRPFITLAAPVFLRDGTRPGGRASLGLAIDLGARLSIAVEAGGAYALSAPDGYEQMVLLGSAGLELGL